LFFKIESHKKNAEHVPKKLKAQYPKTRLSDSKKVCMARGAVFGVELRSVSK